LDVKVLGYALLIGRLFGVGCYFYLVFISPWAQPAVQVSAFIAVAAILAVTPLDRVHADHHFLSH
jgi:hypothetical protein